MQPSASKLSQCGWHDCIEEGKPSSRKRELGKRKLFFMLFSFSSSQLKLAKWRGFNELLATYKRIMVAAKLGQTYRGHLKSGSRAQQKKTNTSRKNGHKCGSDNDSIDPERDPEQTKNRSSDEIICDVRSCQIGDLLVSISVKSFFLLFKFIRMF